MIDFGNYFLVIEGLPTYFFLLEKITAPFLKVLEFST